MITASIMKGLRILTGKKAPSKRTPALSKIKEVAGKTPFFVILFVLALPSERAALYGNVAFSFIVLTNKKRCSSFFEKVFVFKKI